MATRITITPDRSDPAKYTEDAKAEKEQHEETVSQPGGFKNDPDDATNPNEAIERHRQKVRP